jgi:hypothetical protein
MTFKYLLTKIILDSAPNPPRVAVEAGSIFDRGFQIVWDEPTIPKGKIISYRYNIKFENFSYFNPSYCTHVGGDANGTIYVDEPRRFNFTGGAPSSRYFVQVRASNSARDSIYSEPIEVLTEYGELGHLCDHKSVHFQ